MPLNYTAAASSRIKKNKSSSSSLRRSSSSPFASAPRQKPSRPSDRKPKVEKGYDGEFWNEQLDDTGIIVSLGADLAFRDVAQFIEYIQRRMFCEIPLQASGMSSAKITEILEYRQALPPIVTVAHVHALSESATVAEREIAELCQAGIVRKIRIPNRGSGNSAVGEAVVLVSEWEKRVNSSPTLAENVKQKYISLLRSRPTSPGISDVHFKPAEVAALMSAGFLTSPTVAGSSIERFSRPGAATLGTLSSLASVGSRAASGTIEAVGGSDIFTSSGASAGGQLSKASMASTGSGRFYNFSLPNIGSYLKLVASARTQLLTLLSKSSKYREMPGKLLHERWDGGVASDDSASRPKNIRGEFIGVLPGRTKKWKQFYGLRFEWVLEECVGSGLVECFETRSVGIGLRAI